MDLISRAREALIRRSFRRAVQQLAAADAETLSSRTEERVLRVFQKAAKTVPAYRRLLEREDVPASAISSLEEFQRRVPIIDKKSWFGHGLRDICAGSNLEGIASFYSSSGQTGFFSYGVETRKEQKQGALFLEFALQQAFGVLDRKTLLINCLPMGVRVHTRSLALAETSVREDVVWALLKKLAGEFEQFVLLGEHPFLKHMIEEGAAQPNPIDWAKLRIHVVTGAEYVAENFRLYLAELLKIDLTDPNAGMIAVNYGLSELSVSIAHENWHTIQIRKLAQQDWRFQKALFGSESPFLPNVMQYYPSQVYLETLPISPGREELVVTLLDPNRRIPMIRYNAGDAARLVTHSEMADKLRAFGHAELIPPLPLPILFMWGKCKGLPTDSGIAYPERIKQELYADSGMAAAVTGDFRLRKARSGVKVVVQLKEGLQRPLVQVQDDLRSRLTKIVGGESSLEILSYQDYPFGMRHDFERKNQYIDFDGAIAGE